MLIKPHNKKHIGSTFLFSTIALLYYSQLSIARDLAQTPFYLQNISTEITGYTVKPNITLLVDDSGSMIANVSDEKGPISKCRKYVIQVCKEKEAPLSTECKNWNPVHWTHWVYPPEHIIKNSISVPPVLPTDPANKITQVIYNECYNYTRMDVVRDILKDVVKTHRHNFNFVLQTLNQTHFSTKFFDTAIPANYTTLQEEINSLIAKNQWGTPTFSRFNAAARNVLMNGLKYRCQKSYMIFLSDGVAQGEHKPITDSTLAGKDKNYGYDGYFDGDQIRDDEKMFKANWANPNFIYSLQYYTDTLRTKNFADFIYTKDILNPSGKEYIQTTKRSDRRLTDDAGQPWNGPDPLAHLPGHTANFTQTAQTFIIGFGLNSTILEDQLGIELLQHAASPKPDYDPVTNPKSRYYFNALTPDSVKSAFQTIFDEIQAQTQADQKTITTITPMMGSSSTKKSELLIKTMVDTESWSSQLCFYTKKIDTDDKQACKIQPSFSNRKLVLNDGIDSYLYSDSLHSDNLNNERFKIRNNANKNNQEWRDGLLSWFSRAKDDAKIKQGDFVLDYRQRSNKSNFGSTSNMGDIINNSIETIGNIEFGKRKYLITSANDGMVYIFRAANSNTNPYDLKFNYMPMAIERNSTDGSDLIGHYYQNLTSNSYGVKPQHLYLLNGGFTVVETPPQTNKPQQIFMVSNMGQAGRGAFAINIGGKDLVTGNALGADNMNNTNWYKDLFLFQTPSGANNPFGYTVGTPAIAIARVNRDNDAPTDTYTDHLRELAFINNGFNFPGKDDHAHESALHIYDVLGVDVGSAAYTKTGNAKGTLVKSLVTIGRGGLASPVVYDNNNDGVADLIYAGDYSGNLYRFDIRNPNPDKWTATRIFQAPGPITTAPALFTAPNMPNKVIVVFGTGSDLYQSDLMTKNQQYIYGIYDEYDKESNGYIHGNELVRQNLNYTGNTGELTSAPIYGWQKGWYFLLNPDGERVTTNINQLLSTGMVITKSYNHKSETENLDPSKDPCQIGKTIISNTTTSRFIQFDSRNGGKVKDSDPHFVLYDNDIPITSSSVSMNGAVGMLLSTPNVYNPLNAGQSGQQQKPGDISPPMTCFVTTPELNLSNGTVSHAVGIPLCRPQLKRLSWREIKTGFTN
jgi:type IV pilus assembly protein PilY1